MERLFVEGLVLQASLIFALGAQNLFVLESGMRRQYPLVVSFVCFICDLILIMLGVAGAATLLSKLPYVKIVIGGLGVAFLFQYGMSKIFARPVEAGSQELLNQRKDLRRSILLAITFSILNPHAYLDAFVLIGGYSAKYTELNERLSLGFGAACFSGIWFVMLSSASSYIQPLLADPIRMRRVLSAAGFVLVLLSGKLGLDVFRWATEEFGGLKVLNGILYPMSPGNVFTAILY